MHTYLVRIELHNSSLLDYVPLHQEMRKVGFSTTIIKNNGVEYHLPSAEYRIYTSWSFNEVLNIAKRCANTTKRISSVLVVEFTQWIEDGMIPVRK